MKNYTADEIIEWHLLVEMVGSDEEYISDLLNKWFSDHSETLTRILNAIESANADDILIYSHKLKGSAVIFGMNLLSAAAAKLETASGVHNKDIWPALYANLRNEFEKAREFIARPDWFEISRRQSAIHNIY